MRFGLDLLEGRPYNLLTLIITLAGIGVGVFFAVKALRVGQRRLSVVALPPAPLLTDHSQKVPKLQVTHNGTVLPNPYIVTFSLENHGRAAIDSSCFDQGRPIRFNLAVPVIEILQVSLRPTSKAGFAHSQEAEAIVIGPDVLRPAQRLYVQALVAEKPDVTAALEEHLTGTEFEYVKPGDNPKFRPRTRLELGTRLVLIFFACMLASTIIATVVSNVRRPNAALDFSPRTAAAGQSVEIRGTKFRPNSKVSVSVRCDYSSGAGLLGLGDSSDNYPLADLTTDSSGSFRTRTIIPNVSSFEGCAILGFQDSTTWQPAVIASQGFLKH